MKRVAGTAAILVALAAWAACGQVYRPVVIPCSTGGVPGCPVETNPQPSSFHTVFGVTANAASNPGGALQIDVAGDTIIGETPSSDPSKPNLGDVPTYAAILPNDTQVFVTSAGSVLPGGVDLVSHFTPAFQSTTATGLGIVSSISMPAGSQPVFVNSTQTNSVYTANYGTNSVSAIDTTFSVIKNSATVGTNPVSLAEMPNGLKLYVANQGSNSVSSLNAVDLSANTVSGFAGVSPVWVVARGDNQKVYVLTQGDGQLVTIDTATDAVTSTSPVGAGANYLYDDSHLNRLYVTNPATSMVYVFSATSAGADIPAQVAAISFAAGSVACPAGCTPVSVTALADGSRFYVANYQSPGACSDPSISGACIIPGLTVFDANSLAVKYPAAPTVTLLSSLSFAANQTAVPPVASCAPVTPFTPGSTRFRMFATASTDSARVYVSMCDAGAIAVVDTSGANANNTGTPVAPDTLVADMMAPPAVCATTSCSATATISGFSIKGNVVTFQGANTFAAGQRIAVLGLASGTYLNQLTLTVLATGLSGSQFECAFSHADVTATSDSGSASPVQTQSPLMLLAGQ